MNFINLPLELKERILIETKDLFLTISLGFDYSSKIIVENSYYKDIKIIHDACISQKNKIFFEWAAKNIKNENILSELCYSIILIGDEEENLFYFRDHVSKNHIDLLSYCSSFANSDNFLNMINFISNFSEECSYSIFESALFYENANMIRWLLVNKNRKLNEYNQILINCDNTNMVGIALRNGMPEILDILLRNTIYTPMPDDYLVASQNISAKTSLCFKVLEKWMIE